MPPRRSVPVPGISEKIGSPSSDRITLHYEPLYMNLRTTYKNSVRSWSTPNIINNVTFWSTLVRSAPVELVAPVASVLAFLAWLSGDGALAWCALERAAEGAPPCSLAGRVAEALERALPPVLWEQRR